MLGQEVCPDGMGPGSRLCERLCSPSWREPPAGHWDEKAQDLYLTGEENSWITESRWEPWGGDYCWARSGEDVDGLMSVCGLPGGLVCLEVALPCNSQILPRSVDVECWVLLWINYFWSFTGFCFYQMQHSQISDFVCNIPFLKENIKNIFENVDVGSKSSHVLGTLKPLSNILDTCMKSSAQWAVTLWSSSLACRDGLLPIGVALASGRLLFRGSRCCHAPLLCTGHLLCQETLMEIKNFPLQNKQYI